MGSKLPNLFIFRNLLLLLTMGLSLQQVFSQELYIGTDAEFYLPNNAVFTTNNTIVQVADNGIFSVEAGNTWGSATEFVNGTVTAYGNGNTKLPVGDNGVYAAVVMEHSTDVSAKYNNAAPDSGTNGTNVDAVGTVEYWELNGTAIVTLPYNENSDITSLVNDNGGSLNAVSIVGLNGGVWDLISASQTSIVTGDLLNGTVTSDLASPVNLGGYNQFTFGIDHQIVLSVNDLFLTTGISLLSNPVRSEESNIKFMTSGEMVDLKASIYDTHGRLMRRYDHVDLNFGEGYLPKSNLKSGLYFLKFEHEGKQGVKKIIIE